MAGGGQASTSATALWFSVSRYRRVHEKGGDPVAHGRPELLGGPGAHVAGGEDPRHGCLHGGAGDEEPARIALDGVAQEPTVGLQADEYECCGGGEALGGAVTVADHDGGEPVPLAFEPDDVHPGVDGELGVGAHPLLEDGGGRQLGAGQDPDALGELREVQALLQGGVAAADHHDLVGPLVEGPVTRGAEVDPCADELVLAGDVEAAVGRPRGHDHGVRGELLAR